MEKLKRVGIRLVTEQEILSEKEIHDPDDAIDVISGVIKDMDRECVCILNLRSSGVPINFEIASIGTVNASLVNPRELLKSSILSNAANVIVLHNHPGGSVEASKEDFDVTKRLMKAYDLMGINVLDHVIVANGKEERYSMKEMGMLDRMMDEIRGKDYGLHHEVAAERKVEHKRRR